MKLVRGEQSGRVYNLGVKIKKGLEYGSYHITMLFSDDLRIIIGRLLPGSVIKRFKGSVRGTPYRTVPLAPSGISPKAAHYEIEITFSSWLVAI